MKYRIIHNKSLNEARSLFLKLINSSEYIKIDDSKLLIEKNYYLYNFFDGAIQNLRYFYSSNNETINGSVDVSLVMSSPLSILNKITKELKLEMIDDEIEEYNKNSYLEDKKLFIRAINDKAYENAYELIKKNKNKDNKLDIEPIKDFLRLDEKKVYEEIYIFKYVHNGVDYISIYSTANDIFYELCFPKTELFLEYVRIHGRPISNIPKRYYDLYYSIGFKVYLNVLEILKYSSEKELLKKIKKGINKESSMFNEYINILIFYYKNNKALAYLDDNTNNMRIKILYNYLSLKYKKEAGLYLYNCSRLNLLDRNDLYARIKYLEISYSLKGDIAKNLLYKHYSNYAYFNERKRERYSK